MKKVARVICLLLFFSNNTRAQDSCTCTRHFTPRYPIAAERAGICGTVIIEYEKLEDGSLQNPVLLKGLGYGCDEEALNCVRKQIEFHNDCLIKCNHRKDTSVRKRARLRADVKFACPE
jgi:hypothetical protein